MRALESDHSTEPLQVSRPSAENFRLPQAVDMAGVYFCISEACGGTDEIVTVD